MYMNEMKKGFVVMILSLVKFCEQQSFDLCVYILLCIFAIDIQLPASKRCTVTYDLPNGYKLSTICKILKHI